MALTNLCNLAIMPAEPLGGGATTSHICGFGKENFPAPPSKNAELVRSELADRGLDRNSEFRQPRTVENIINRRLLMRVLIKLVPKKTGSGGRLFGRNGSWARH